jgi:hypothetical protein
MFPVAAGLAIPLAFVGSSSAALVSAIVFGAAVTAMFAVSGFYHVITWRPAVRRWLARLDHATVYGLIAPTYMPFGLLVLDGAWQVTMLAIVWSGAAVAIPSSCSGSALKWLSRRSRSHPVGRASPRMPEITERIGVDGLLRRGRWTVLHGLRSRVRATPSQSVAGRLRIPMAFHARDRSSRSAVRGDRVPTSYPVLETNPRGTVW